jgi:hypothetical protein
VIGSLDDDGMLTFGMSLADLLNALTPESRSPMNPTPAASDPQRTSHLIRP